MRAGPKRQRITVQVLSESQDSYGQKLQSWVDDGTYWAEIRTLSGREAVNAKQVKAETTHAVNLRYIGSLFPTGGLLPSSRLSFNGRIFNILYINNINERNREYQLLAQELVPATPTS